MNNNSTKDDLNQIEEDLKESENKEHRKGSHKVSGKSVFKLQEIIKNKPSNLRKKENDKNPKQSQ